MDSLIDLKEDHLMSVKMVRNLMKPFEDEAQQMKSVGVRSRGLSHVSL